MNIPFEEIEKAALAFSDKPEFAYGELDYLDVRDAFEKGAEWVLEKIAKGYRPDEK